MPTERYKATARVEDNTRTFHALTPAVCSRRRPQEEIRRVVNELGFVGLSLHPEKRSGLERQHNLARPGHAAQDGVG